MVRSYGTLTGEARVSDEEEESDRINAIQTTPALLWRCGAIFSMSRTRLSRRVF